MGLQFIEHWDSANGSLGDNAGDTYRIMVWGDPVKDNADSELAIMLFAIARFAQVSSLGNILAGFDREKIAPGLWLITANYRSATEIRQSTAMQLSFTTNSGSQHITHSRQTMGVYGRPGKTAIDYKGAINVSADNTVDGMDIGPGTATGITAEFHTTHYLPVVQQSLIDFLMTHPCAVNTSTSTITCNGLSFVCKPGELQLQYAEGSERAGFGDFELSLHWAINRNATNIKIGDITVDTKNGWDYLWIATGPDADTVGMAVRPIPIGAYIERVYEYADLNPVIMLVTQAGVVMWSNPTANTSIHLPTLTIPTAIF